MCSIHQHFSVHNPWKTCPHNSHGHYDELWRKASPEGSPLPNGGQTMGLMMIAVLNIAKLVLLSSVNATHTSKRFISLMCCVQDAQPTAAITCTMDRQRPRIFAKDPSSSLRPVPRPVRKRLQDVLAVALIDTHWRNIWWISFKPGKFLFRLFKWCFYASLLGSMDLYFIEWC